VEGAEVGILEESDYVGLGRLLEGLDGRGLEPEFLHEVLGDLPDEALEGELADEELGGLLVAADLAEGDGSGPVAMGFPDLSVGLSWRRGSGPHLSRELGMGRLSSSGDAAGVVLGAGH